MQIRWDLTHSLLIETTRLVSVPNKAQVPDVSLQKESVRDKGMGKKWFSLERYTFHRENVVCLKGPKWPLEKCTPQTECGPSQKMRGSKYGVSFYELGDFTG